MADSEVREVIFQERLVILVIYIWLNIWTLHKETVNDTYKYVIACENVIKPWFDFIT